MTDLAEVLPDFDIKPYRHLTHSLQKNGVTVLDLITYDANEIAKRCPLPLRDLKVFMQDVVKALQGELDLGTAGQPLTTASPEHPSDSHDAIKGHKLPFAAPETVKTLDPEIDRHLGGGFPTGHITEIVGESAVGKTQFMLGILLSCQLPPPHGLGRSAVYLSTEAPLNTGRLHQMLASHPHYQDLSDSDRPTLDRIHTMVMTDLETQEHIIKYQLPIAVKRFNVGLIVMDSVTANFRAEHETKTIRGLADRAVDLMVLGNTLRQIARDNGLAVVLANQVSDRFDDARTIQDRIRSSSPFTGSSPSGHRMPPPLSSNGLYDERLTLDHQQRFFTGWGDQPESRFEPQKTPALGLAWANQLSARVVLKMEAESVFQQSQDHVSQIWKDRKKKRYLNVVFAPWVAPSLKPLEYEIQAQGPVFVPEKVRSSDQHADLLDPTLWSDGAFDAEDEYT